MVVIQIIGMFGITWNTHWLELVGIHIGWNFKKELFIIALIVILEVMVIGGGLFSVSSFLVDLVADRVRFLNFQKDILMKT